MGSKTFDPLAVLGLYTETPLHCGSESAAGYVDLPVQRERHTEFPVIPGSTIKGVLRDEMKGSLGADHDAVFGKEDASLPGSVSFGDGMLVAFPVRSSLHPFHWATCPLALERVFRALREPVPPEIGTMSSGEALAKDGGQVLLEEIVLTKKPSAPLFGDKGALHRLLDLVPPGEQGFAYTRSVFLDRLLICSDADFRELVTTGTEMLTRIKLDEVTGTTSGEHGNMFVEEIVPPETLFFCALRAARSDVMRLEQLPSILRLGGDETIGRGLTHVATAAVSRKER